jgi:hypothetical protein
LLIASAMKTVIALSCVFGLLFAFRPPAQAEPSQKRLSMEQRLRETDIAVTLKHYERVCSELMESRLKQDLISVEGSAKPEEREQQAKMLALRIDVLERYARALREELLKAGRMSVAFGESGAP